MRLKLVLLTSLLGAILGAVVPIVILVTTLGRSALYPARFGFPADGWINLAVNLPPLLTAVLGAVFVYRHTARRRKLQAVLCGILVLILSVVAYVAAFLVVPVR